MKKRLRTYLSLLCMLACVFSLTACGDEKSDKVTYSDESAEIFVSLMKQNGYAVEDVAADIQTEAESVADSIIMNMIEQDRDELSELYKDDETYDAIAQSYLEATEELGDYVEDSLYNLTFDISDENVLTVAGAFEFEERDLNFNYSADLMAGTYDITFERELSIGEILEKAGLNTLLGMGTVFLVLILISFIISLFKLFSGVGTSSSEKKPAAPAATATPAPTATSTVPATSTAPLPAEIELAIVMATAIAAAEEETGSDGYKVRSIKRVKNSKWRRA